MITLHEDFIGWNTMAVNSIYAVNLLNCAAVLGTHSTGWFGFHIPSGQEAGFVTCGLQEIAQQLGASQPSRAYALARADQFTFPPGAPAGLEGLNQTVQANLNLAVNLVTSINLVPVVNQDGPIDLKIGGSAEAGTVRWRPISAATTPFTAGELANMRKVSIPAGTCHLGAVTNAYLSTTDAGNWQIVPGATP